MGAFFHLQGTPHFWNGYFMLWKFESLLQHNQKSGKFIGNIPQKIATIIVNMINQCRISMKFLRYISKLYP
jgi:hypothetical protein